MSAGTGSTDFTQDPALATSDPLGTLLGHTSPLPPTEDFPTPLAGARPRGQSGRANFWGLPQPDELNRELVGVEGLKRFNEMYRTDAHIRRLILAAWSPLVAGTWTLEPYGGDDATDQDRQVADDIWWMLTQWMTPNFQEHLYEVGPLLLRSGFTPCEEIWDTVERDGKTLLGPRSLQVRLPISIWRWWQDDFGQLTHIGQILPDRADVVIPASEILYYRLGPEGDNWMGTSLIRHAYKHWLMKDRLERIDAIGQERKAVGVPVIYPPSGATPQQKSALERVLMQLHVSESTYVMMPGPKAGSQGANAVPQEEWLLEIEKFDSSSGSGIMDSIDYHKMSIASSFLEDFLELGHHQVGARATAEVQEDPFLTAINGALLPPVIPPWNRLIDRIRRLNWASAEGSPTLQLNLTDEASLSEIAAYVQQLVAAGVVQVDPELEDWVRSRGGMPAANADIRAQREAAAEAGRKAAIDGLNNPASPAPPAEGEPATPAPAQPAAKDQPAAESAPAEPKPASKPRRKLSRLIGHRRELDAPAVSPTVPWFERLLSRDQLQVAFDGCRDHIEEACGPVVGTVAAKMANQAANGALTPGGDPPPELVDALTKHYSGLYQLGQQTVATELAKQRAHLRKTLDDLIDSDVGAAGVARARSRAEHSARNIVSAIHERAGRDQITGLKDAPAVDEAARKAGAAQLRKEALSNVTATINDGRNDQARATRDVVGAFYTSCMDERSCDPCIEADTGEMLSPSDAVALGPPNPNCLGGEFCRCTLVWVLSDDPAALGLAT